MVLNTKMRTEEREKYIKMIWWLNQHPVHALWLLLGIKLAPHQRICFRQMWFANNVGLKLSRGLSKTFLLACYLTLKMLLKKGATQMAITRGFRGGKLLFREGIQPIIAGTLDGQIQKRYAIRCLENFKKNSSFDAVRIINRDPDIWQVRGKYNAHITTGPLGKDVSKSSQLRGQRANTTLALDESADIGDDLYNAVIRPFSRVRSNPVNDNPDANMKVSDFTKIEAGTIKYDWQRYTRELNFIESKMMENDPYFVLLEFNYEDCFFWKNNIKPENQDIDIRKEIKAGKLIFPYRLNLEDLFDELLNGSTSFEDFMSENKNRVQLSLGTEFSAELLDSICGIEVEGKYVDSIDDEDSIFHDPDHMDNTLFPLLGCNDPCVLGVDPARQSDEAAFVVIRLGSERKIPAPFNDVIFSMTKRKVPYWEIADTIRMLLVRYPNIKRVYLDAGGGGLAVRDHLWYPEKTDENTKFLPMFDPEDEDTPQGVRERGIPILRKDDASNEKNTIRVNYVKGQMQIKRFLLPGFLYSTGDKDLDEAYRSIRNIRRQFSYIMSEPSGNFKRYYVDEKYKKDLFSATLLAMQGIYDLTGEMALASPVTNEVAYV